jgi:putative hydroxymethylpyrimidine transport system ATP-binding protein
LNLIWIIPAEEAVHAPTIHIRNATLAYNGNPVFEQLSMGIPAGKWTALLGPSGIGKSSLLRMIAGLTRPQEKCDGLIQSDLDTPIEHLVAYMAQTDLLLPWLTVLQNACIGSALRSLKHHEKAPKLNQAIILLQQVGLSDAINLYPHQLSGGMRQKAALVRTLMENKPIVLMDEPFSALDAITRYQLQDLAAELLHDKTVLFITHDPIEALRLADSIYIMQGKPARIMLAAELTSKTPRPFDHPDITQQHAALLQALLHAAGHPT